MNQIAFPKLARMAVLLIMVCGILVFGASNPAWATPGQAPFGQTVTTTPGGAPEQPRLTINQLRCSGENVLVEFTVRQIFGNVSDFGEVSYTVNGLGRTAHFDRLTGTNARYFDTIPSSAKSSSNAYEITTGSVTLTIDGVQVTAGLENPNRFSVVCKPKSKQSADCPELSDGHSVGPDAQAEVRQGLWRFVLQVIKCDAGGRFEIREIGQGGAPGPNAGEFFAGSQIEITFFDNKGNVVSNPTFTGSMMLCFDYSAAAVAEAGGIGNLTMQTYDPAQAKWVALATSVGTDGSICAVLPHLSTYTVAIHNPAQGTPPAAAAPVVSSPPDTQPAVAPVVSNAPSAPQPAGAVPQALPNTGEPNANLVPMWLWVLIGLLIGTACIILGWGNIRAHPAAKNPPR